MRTALVVERHPLLRDAMVSLLRVDLGFPEVLAVGTMSDAIEQTVNRSEVKLVVTDLPPPELSGMEGIASLHRFFGAAALIVVSSSDERRDVLAAFRSGACAFVSKAVSRPVLAVVLRRSLAGRMPERQWVTPEGGHQLTEGSWPQLTLRQQGVLSLLCRGYSNKEIALHTGLAEITVKQHVSSILRALAVSNRTQAVLRARRAEQGATPPPVRKDFNEIARR